MNKIITYENLGYFAYSNCKLLKTAPRGIVIDFFGLGCDDMYGEDTAAGKRFAENGIIFLVPYNNPWAWMNRQAVRYTDEIIRVILDRYNLPDTTPIVSSGGSMGGLSAIVYTRYAAVTPTCCVANCPVCDLPFHFTERYDLPRTLYSAFYNEDGDIFEVLKSASPIHLVDSMPKVSYKIFHCDNDTAVNIGKHSEVFVSAMKAAGHDIEYRVVKGIGHCDLPEEERERYYAFAEKAIISG